MGNKTLLNNFIITQIIMRFQKEYRFDLEKVIYKLRFFYINEQECNCINVNKSFELILAVLCRLYNEIKE